MCLSEFWLRDEIRQYKYKNVILSLFVVFGKGAEVLSSLKIRKNVLKLYLYVNKILNMNKNYFKNHSCVDEALNLFTLGISQVSRLGIDSIYGRKLFHARYPNSIIYIPADNTEWCTCPSPSTRCAIGQLQVRELRSTLGQFSNGKPMKGPTPTVAQREVVRKIRDGICRRSSLPDHVLRRFL